MKRLSRWGLVGLLVLVALLSLSASAGGTPGARAKPVKLRTLVTTGKVYAFAQDGNTIAWIGADARVRVRRLSPARTSIIGTVSKERASTAVLALAGTRALWSWDDGGNSTAYPIVTGAPGHASVTIADLGGGLRGMGDGADPTGLAGDGTTLAYGWVLETCTDPRFPTCEIFTGPLVATGGGVSPATWNPQTRPPSLPLIANVPPPALFAVSQGAIATAPARLSTPMGQWVPRVAEDGPVLVYDLSGKLLLRVDLLGIVRDVALSGRKLAVLLELPDGRKLIEQFVVPNPSFVKASNVPLAAADLAIGSGGTIFRVGRDIYALQSSGGPRLVARAAAKPIGLSIEGKRIAWAENVHGKGRIEAVTLR